MKQKRSEEARNKTKTISEPSRPAVGVKAVVMCPSPDLVPGGQIITQMGDLSLDILFLSGLDRTKHLWVLAHLPKSDALPRVPPSDILNCPKVLISLAFSFLRFYFLAILERSNISHPRRWFQTK